MDENEITSVTFIYKPSPNSLKRLALLKFVETHNILYSWHGQSEITILNQKIKDHDFIQKLFNCEL